MYVIFLLLLRFQVNVIFFLSTLYFISFAFIKLASILVHHLLYKLKNSLEISISYTFVLSSDTAWIGE